jgi:hypothetical protein
MPNQTQTEPDEITPNPVIYQECDLLRACSFRNVPPQKREEIAYMLRYLGGDIHYGHPNITARMEEIRRTLGIVDGPDYRATLESLHTAYAAEIAAYSQYCRTLSPSDREARDDAKRAYENAIAAAAQQVIK